MGLGPLKKELESIDQELESAMLQLSETTQRVDDLLADFSLDTGAAPRAPSPSIAPFDRSSPFEPDAEDE